MDDFICYLEEIADLKLLEKGKVFLFSENEPARKSEKRLKKKYPGAKYVVAEGYGHGGLQTAQPEKYAGFVRKILEGTAMPDTIK